MWTDGELKKLFELRAADQSRQEIADALGRTVKGVEGAIRRYQNSFDNSEDTLAKNITSARRQSKINSKLRKEQRSIVDKVLEQEDFLNEIRKLAKTFKIDKQKVAKVKKSKNKKKMTMELMLSDLHYGKLTDTFNNEVARKRMSTLTNVFLEEMVRESNSFNVERCKLLLLGDIIESATMHREESLTNCEFGNQQQVTAAITSLFNDCILPIAKTGIQVDVVGVTGNHDRLTVQKTYNKPGKEYVTHTIYHILKMLCETAGLKNVSFDIPEGTYAPYEVYGSHYLAEHGDMFSHVQKNLEAHLAARAIQCGHVLSGIRFGHLHEELSIGRGRFIRNASLPGTDGYSDINGYANTAASQTINFYVETDSRPTPFYKSFPVYLEDIK